MKAILLSKEQAGDPAFRGCRKCGSSMKEQGGSEMSERTGLCLTCLTSLLGKEVQPSVALLLGKGVILITYYSTDDVYRMRVEVRSASRYELQKMVQDFNAGRVYTHGAKQYRYGASSLHDLNTLGNILMPFQPTLAMILQRYVVQPSKMARSVYAEAVSIKLDARTIHIVKHL